MKIIRIGLHSLVLVIADIAGIAVGALAAFKILGVPNQVWFQVPCAVVISAGSFCLWILSLRVLRWKGVLPADSMELRACLAASIAWAPLVFVPLHYITQGYLTSTGNLVGLALYQLPVNAIALFATARLQNASIGGITKRPAGPDVGLPGPPIQHMGHPR